MMSMTEISVIAQQCWMVVAQAGAADITNNMREFSAVLNGVFNDLQQVKGDNEKHDRIQISMRPLRLSCLGGLATYMEERVNGVVYRQEVEVLTAETKEGFLFTSYNFTGSSRPDPNKLKTDGIEKLKANNFKTDPSCSYIFDKVAPGVYVGTKPDCRHTINGQHPLYGITLTCDSYGITAPNSSVETLTPAPYLLVRTGERFPQRNLPDNYVSPCDKRP